MATHTSKKEEQDRLDAGRGFAVEIAKLAASTRCYNVVILDVSGLSPVTDYFVIATGTSPRQMHSVVEDVDELADRMSFRRISRSDPKSDSWILVDYVDVVVHLFSDNARQFYDLDNLWGDATRVQWK